MNFENPFEFPFSTSMDQKNPDKLKIEKKKEENRGDKIETNIETKLDDKDNKEQIENTEEQMFGFSKKHLEKLFDNFELLDDLRQKENIDQRKINEVLNYLTTEVFPYLQLTLEDEEKYKQKIANEPELDLHIQKINIESFKKTRGFLLEFFLETSVRGVEKNKSREIIQNITPLLRFKEVMPFIQSKLKEKYGSGDILEILEKKSHEIIAEKTIEFKKNYNRKAIEEEYDGYPPDKKDEYVKERIEADFREAENNIKMALEEIINILQDKKDLLDKLTILINENKLDLNDPTILEQFDSNELNELLMSGVVRIIDENIIPGLDRNDKDNPLNYLQSVQSKSSKSVDFILNIKNNPKFREKYIRQFSKQQVFEILKHQAELVKKDNIFCTNRDFEGVENILKEGAILSTYELEEKGYHRNLKANAKYSQEREFGFEEGTPLVYGTLIGGRQIPAANEWKIGGLTRSGTNYGDVFFLVNIDKLKNRIFFTLGEGGSEYRKEDRFSIDHAYLIKAIINMRRALNKEFAFPQDEYLTAITIGKIELKDIESINFFLGEEKDQQKIAQQKKRIEDFKKQYPQFQDKIRIID